ncbi:DUF6643 family protein [Streptomyces meridianus]|uniref:Uncharacterized protein n=1 Tax=Streptomyces meridianus TaxID=2938945 RepID=A0ABT0XB85_9ACTN|nr:DUF6643 family protein [Streptomyces meridianus]MCM2579776.1 hypothetical protein [Streptomyces meridianus]
MTSPRSSYGGGYYSAPFPDTPIYDNLVAERGTPQIAPIRVPAAYDSGSHLPALPALPSGPSHHTPANTYGGNGQQHYAPAPYIPQQASPRGYPGPQQPYQQNPGAGTGYEAMRPAAPRPPARPAPAVYDDPYGRQHPARGY